VVKQGVVEVATRELYDLEGGRTLKKNGALDARMVPTTPLSFTLMDLLTAYLVLGNIFQVAHMRNLR
jgi:hypothetical protein